MTRPSPASTQRPRRDRTAPRPPALRSRVTNGRAILVGVNPQSAGGRRYADLVDEISDEMGGDLTEVERLQARTAAALVFHVEDLTARLVRGEAIDDETMTRSANSALRALEKVRGKGRPASGATKPSVDDYLAARRSAQP